MIHSVGTVSVFVENQDRAKDFYINKLGFDLREDALLFPGSEARWVAVAPSGALNEVILYVPDENWKHYKQVVGKSQALTFSITDMKSFYEKLLANRVNFIQEPNVQPWGTFAIIEDSEGNRLILSEPPIK